MSPQYVIILLLQVATSPPASYGAFPDPDDLIHEVVLKNERLGKPACLIVDVGGPDSYDYTSQEERSNQQGFFENDAGRLVAPYCQPNHNIPDVSTIKRIKNLLFGNATSGIRSSSAQEGTVRNFDHGFPRVGVTNSSVPTSPGISFNLYRSRRNPEFPFGLQNTDSDCLLDPKCREATAVSQNKCGHSKKHQGCENDEQTQDCTTKACPSTTTTKTCPTSSPSVDREFECQLLKVREALKTIRRLYYENNDKKCNDLEDNFLSDDNRKRRLHRMLVNAHDKKRQHFFSKSIMRSKREPTKLLNTASTYSFDLRNLLKLVTNVEKSLLHGAVQKRTVRDSTGHREKVASPPERCPKDDSQSASRHSTSPSSNGQLTKQGSLTIVRRSSGKKKEALRDPSAAEQIALESVDLTTDNLPAVDTPDACDKAALRLRCLLRQLQQGEISAELLQKNLLYAARVLEAVFIDETKEEEEKRQRVEKLPRQVSTTQKGHHHPRRLRAPVWARSPVRRSSSVTQDSDSSRRLADEDDELSEVQPDAVPPEVREWLASTFTRQLATTRRRNDEKPKFRSVANAIRAGIFVDRMYRKGTTAALMQFPAEVVKVLKTLDEWSFDVFALSESAGGQPVKYLSYDLLNRYGILHKFKVVPTTLENFLVRIEEGYCKYKNPYHNNLHATDVAQTVHYMLCQTGLMNWLTDLEIFATLIAAVIHDFEHTGTTNNFHVMSGTDTALLYNDRAVLENHHISASFRVLREDECNILQNLSREEFREFRSLVIDMVLATDMSFHFQQLKNMKNLLTLAEPSVDKSKALSLVLHCCDISHPAKRWDLHHRWTSQLLEEFFRQGDKERDLGLPFSPLCDRNNTLVAESQIGFIDFIVEPSMGVCSDMLEVILAPIMGTTSQSEGNLKSQNEENSCTIDDEERFRIKKPWVECLAENKKIWKEKAIQDAEARAAIGAEKEGREDIKEE